MTNSPRPNPPLVQLLLLFLLPALPAVADETPPRAAEKFEIEGNQAFLYAAPRPAPGKPWVWYAPTIKGMSIVGRKMYYEGLLNAGIGIAGFDLGEVRGGPASTAKFTRFSARMARASRPSSK